MGSASNPALQERSHFPFSFSSEVFVLILLALAKVLLHTLTNHQYGFHRDELATLDDARHLAWGYVAYPPLTPVLASVELELFGTSLAGFRFLAGDRTGGRSRIVGTDGARTG